MKSLLLIISVLMPLWCMAVSPYVPQIADPVLEPWRWRAEEALDGLGVICMDEAEDGVFWFGCVGGLVRYDGMTVERFPFDEELMALVDHDRNRIPWGKSLLCMEDGSVLVALEYGLVQWTNGHWKVIRRNIGVSLFESRIERSDDGSVWVLSAVSLRFFSSDLSAEYTVLRASATERLLAFCRDDEGDVWIVRSTTGSPSELIHIPIENGQPLKKTMWQRYPVGEDSAWFETAVCAGPDGRIWYVDNRGENGVLAFNPRERTWETTEFTDSKIRFYSLIKDADGTLWAGGSGELYSVRKSGGRHYPGSVFELPSIPLNIFQAASGRLWVIGRGGDVYSLDPGHERWLTYIGLHYECETATGTQWYLTPNGNAVSYDPVSEQWRRYSAADGLIDATRALYFSRHGLVWASGSHDDKAAISVFNGKHWERRVHPEFALRIGEKAIYESEDGTLWFGASGQNQLGSGFAGGALQYEVTPEGSVRLLKHHAPPEVPYHISGFAGVPDGSFWLCSSRLYHYDTASSNLQVAAEVPAVYTHDLVMDENRDLWIAKGLSGIFRKEGDEWRNYTKSDGLAGKFVVDLLPLSDGTMLAALEKGISRFDGVGWAGNVLSEDFGMSNRGGNMRQSADGSVWYNFNYRDARSPRVIMNFESEYRYCTVRQRAETQPPETQINPHPVELDSEGNLYVSWSGQDRWGDTPVAELYYSRRINDGEWSPFINETGWTFLNLDHGKHVLEVRARDRDFNIDPTPAVSQFMVIPPVWQRGWFIAMLLSLIGVSVAFVGMLFYFHEKRQKEQKKHLIEMDQLKTGFFTNISHELNTPLGLIKGALEHMLDSEEEREKLCDVAMRSVDRVSTLVSQFLDFRKIEQGRIRIEAVEGDISGAVREHLELLLPLAENKQVSCEIQIVDSCTGWFDPDKLKKIISNLQGNAIKYTPAGGAVRVVVDELLGIDGSKTLFLVVEDSGDGIEAKHLQHIFNRFYRIPEKSIVDGSGIGLNLTKELVDLWGGSIRAESPIHQKPEYPGARFTVLLPIDLENIPNAGGDNEKSQ